MESVERIPQLPGRAVKTWKNYLLESFLAAGGALVITGLIAVFHLYPTINNISIVYLVLILVLASTYGRYAAIFASVVAFLAFDFFLVPPLYTFNIGRWEEWLSLLVFLVTALITSQLTATARANIEQARLREREFWILYEVGRAINSTGRLDEQLESIALAVIRVFAPWGASECALFIPDENGNLTMQADAPIRVEQFALTPDEFRVAQEVMSEGKVKESKQGEGQKTFLRFFPLKTAPQVLGVLCLRLERDVSWFATEQAMVEEKGLPHDQAIFFWTFLDDAVMKIEQARLRGSSGPSQGE